MSNYTKTTDFQAKDSLPTGDSGKIIRGSEFETEFDAISTAIATKADTAGPTFTGTLTFETISDGTINVTAFVDEDDMSSDSATLVPTQQSVKAYVDSQVTAQDLDFQADTGGALSIDLDSETLTFTGGTGIDTSGSGNAVTFAIDSTVATLTGTQTLTNKTLTSPDVNTPDIDGGTIDGTVIGGTTTAAGSFTSVNATSLDVAGTIEFDGLSGTGAVSVTDILDQDDMSSNSATALATQQSIKAYVDSQVATADTLSEVLANGNTTGGTDIAVGTGDDITFADSSKAIFGAGSDLEIFHSGSHSIIRDNGDGDLRLEASDDIFLRSVAGETYARFRENLGAELYYDNNQKFATTATGIDVTGVITTDGLTTSADINFGDNDKAVFGAGSDLQIYHDGSNSYITDSGTGNLRISGTLLQLNDASFNKYLLGSGDSVTLYHADTAKLATTSSGIDVTGTASADALDVNGAAKLNSNSAEGLQLGGDASGSTLIGNLKNTSGRLTLQSTTGRNVAVQTNGATDRILVSSGGDISFYEDTGTTAKFFWDASAESLGLGTTSPTTGYGGTSALDASGPVVSRGAIGSHQTNAGVFQYNSNETAIRSYGATSGSGLITFSTGGGGAADTERMRINSNGYVGIGTSSPRHNLSVSGNNATAMGIALDNASGSGTADISILGASYGSHQAGAGEVWFYSPDNINIGGATGNTNNIKFLANNKINMFIEGSSGNVGIGTSSPAGPLHVFNSSAGEQFISSSNSALRFVSTGGANYIQSGTATSSSSAADLIFTNVGGSGETMRIDSSGSVGIGCTPASTVSLDVQNLSASSNNVFLRIKNTRNLEDSGLIIEGQNGGAREYKIGVNSIANSPDLTFSGPTGYRYYVGSSEAMRIDSSGNLLVGVTSKIATGGFNPTFNVSSATNTAFLQNTGGIAVQGMQTGGTTAAQNFVVFYNGNGSAIGSIQVANGTAGTTVSYNTSSDQRLKDNIVDAPSASDDIDAIQVRSFDWKADGSHQKYGMVAQELQSVAPEAVTGDADSDDMMGVDYSKLVPMLVKEIQSLRARVAQLEGAN